MLCDKKHSHVQWRDFKMNVLVCDDDQQIVDSIIEELKKKSEETHVALRFYGFSQPSQIDLSLPYDIALLDIDMGETNGIELARKLRAENENIVIIFITNFIQYAPEGFEVQAFRYLLKADLSAKLDSYFDSAVQEVLRRKQLVTISINSEIIDVPVNDILYLESHRRIIVMHLLDEKRPAYQFYGNITELSEKIEPLGFLRIQKSYLVNMHYVEIFQYTKTLLAGGMPQAPLICIFQCRLRIPSGRFLSGDVLRVVEDLYEVRSGFCQRSILHLFRDRRIQKRNAPFLHTEKANLNKLRGMQHRKVAHRAYRR